MWKLLLVGVNYLASLHDTCIFRPEWLSDQNTIFHMLEEAVSHQELGNQRWASPNPHRLWQCIKHIKPRWHERGETERGDCVLHQLIDSLFSRLFESRIGFRLPPWKLLQEKINATKLQHVTSWMSMIMPAGRIFHRMQYFHSAVIGKLFICSYIKHSNISRYWILAVFPWAATPSIIITQKADH